MCVNDDIVDHKCYIKRNTIVTKSVSSDHVAQKVKNFEYNWDKYQ